MPQRHTRGGAAGAAALSGLIWACTAVFFRRGERSLPLSLWKRAVMTKMLLCGTIKPFLDFCCGQYVPLQVRSVDTSQDCGICVKILSKIEVKNYIFFAPVFSLHV